MGGGAACRRRKARRHGHAPTASWIAWLASGMGRIAARIVATRTTAGCASTGTLIARTPPSKRRICERTPYQ
eukprot:4463545-Prorocentrum_lima.AAC.1